MEPIYIPKLVKYPDQSLTLEVRSRIRGLGTLTEVTGGMQVTHQGNYLEVAATVETIVTLTCDRCLQQYNHRLKIDDAEMIWFDEIADRPDMPEEREVAMEELVEVLHPHGYFNPDEWLYEQLCLALPHRRLCDRQCPGIQLGHDSADYEPQVDRRWAGLAGLKFNNKK